MSQIKDKVVLITGASSGIGDATARVLSRKGAAVVLGARRTGRLKTLAEELRNGGGRAEYRALDVTTLEDVQAFVKFCLEAYGRIDVIVNNAGVMPLSRLEELKVDEWNRMIDVNIRGVLHGIAATLPIMKKQGVGRLSIYLPAGATLCTPQPRSTAPQSSRSSPSLKDYVSRTTRSELRSFHQA